MSNDQVVKHTPGPWTVNFKGSADIVADFGGNDTAVATVDGPKDNTHHLVHEEHRANALLIAAAPDLKLQNEINMDFLIELLDHFPIESGARAEIEDRIHRTRIVLIKSEGAL